MSRCQGLAQGPFGRAALLEIDKPIVGHAHPHCHLLVKVAGADSYFRVRGRDYPLDNRSAVAVNSWEPHAYPTAPSQGAAIILALYIRTDWLRTMEPGFALCGRPDFFGHTSFELPASIRSQIGDLADALSASQSASPEFDTLLGGLMTAVIDRYSRWRDLRGSQIVDHWSIPDHRLRRAVTFMRDNIDIPYTADDIAREAGLSRAHLFAQFKRHTGLTPHLFHSALRMETAFDALPAAAQSMADISSRLGFSRQGHFTRFFRNNLGISPREYRNLIREHMG